MKISKGALQDVILIEPSIFEDNRGLFFESFNSDTWQNQGLPYQFVQDNQSLSANGVLRGLHFQQGVHAQGKLVRVISGRVLDIAVDMRPESTTFGRWEFYDLDAITNKMVYIPTGFAHGFLALEESIFSYKCTAGYNKESEGGIIWNDPTLKIDWPIDQPNVSEKDLLLPTFDSYFKNL
jgi:dTDP-4-dehydrorhamnose 3,5-epimerase